eukprot:364740-Chlamydomonas_euryale.AAC.6
MLSIVLSYDGTASERQSVVTMSNSVPGGCQSQSQSYRKRTHGMPVLSAARQKGSSSTLGATR